MEALPLARTSASSGVLHLPFDVPLVSGAELVDDCFGSHLVESGSAL